MTNAKTKPGHPTGGAHNSGARRKAVFPVLRNIPEPMYRAHPQQARHSARKHPARTRRTNGLQPFPQEIPQEAPRGAIAETAAMARTSTCKTRDEATGCMKPNRHHTSEPETSQERIARVQAAAAVQIARAAAGQPTGWTVIREIAHWVLARLDRVLEQAS